MIQRVLLLLTLSLLPLSGALAHKLAPSLLDLKEQSNGIVEAHWRTTEKGVKSLEVLPPAVCRVDPGAPLRREGTAWISETRWYCDPKGLVGLDIAVNGLDGDASSVLLKVALLDGRNYSQWLKADDAKYRVPARQSWGEVLVQYLELGVEHIWFGPDHLLFVLGLLLLVVGWRRLLITITAFTLGHSVTLILVALGWMHYPAAAVEWLIAASILVLALELCREHRSASWLSLHTGWVAAGFGLLHGLGFAGALKEVGLPQLDLPLALLGFNIGIELGQIAFVAAVMMLLQGLERLHHTSLVLARWSAIYLMGSASVFWCLDRSVSLLG